MAAPACKPDSGADAITLVRSASIGGLAALFYPESPFYRMQELAGDVKLWAIVVVIGGTFPTLRALDSGLFGGEVIHLVRQMAVIMAGFLAATPE